PAHGAAPCPGAAADAPLSARYGVPAGFVQGGIVNTSVGTYQVATGFGRGCFADVILGDHCTFNGPRWFQGANETKANPNSGNVAGTGDATDNNNAGELPG